MAGRQEESRETERSVAEFQECVGFWVESLNSPNDVFAAQLQQRPDALIDLSAAGHQLRKIAYLRKIYAKFGVSDRLELALYCLHNKIIKTDADEVAVVQRVLAR